MAKEVELTCDKSLEELRLLAQTLSLNLQMAEALFSRYGVHDANCNVHTTCGMRCSCGLVLGADWLRKVARTSYRD